MRTKGVYAALASAFFLGMAPVFGKLAINQGMPWQGVVALRTILAASLLLLVILINKLNFLYIYPAGLLGCLLAGGINGVGSLFYYAALGRIDASLGQLLYSFYPLSLVLWLWLDRQPPTKLTIFRFLLTIPAVILLIQAEPQGVDFWGVLMMLVSAALYALHIPINQRVLFDMPAPTVALYTLLSMSIVVLPAYFISGVNIYPALNITWWPVLGLSLVTFFSRLALFMGVKHLGGMQTALLGLGELLVTIFISHLWLAERLSFQQWAGAGLLSLSLVLISFEKKVKRTPVREGWLGWLRPPGLPRDMPWPHE